MRQHHTALLRTTLVLLLANSATFPARAGLFDLPTEQPPAPRETPPPKASDKPRLAFDVRPPKPAVRTGERIVVTALLENNSDSASGDVRVGIRLPASAKLLETEPKQVETRGEWRIVTVGRVRARGATYASFTVEAPATETKLALEIRAQAPEGELDPKASRWAGDVAVIAPPRAE